MRLASGKSIFSTNKLDFVLTQKKMKLKKQTSTATTKLKRNQTHSLISIKTNYDNILHAFFNFIDFNRLENFHLILFICSFFIEKEISFELNISKINHWNQSLNLFRVNEKLKVMQEIRKFKKIKTIWAIIVVLVFEDTQK